MELVHHVLRAKKIIATAPINSGVTGIEGYPKEDKTELNRIIIANQTSLLENTNFVFIYFI